MIIATGGFQGSSKLVAKHIGPGADSMFIRSDPHSTGDGYALAQQAGVGTSRGLSTFYGHLLPSPLQNRQVSPTDFIHLAQFQSSNSILVNSEGRRFCDETFGDEVNNQHLARQPDRVGYVILSEAVKQKYAVGAPFPNAWKVDRLEKARKVGGRVTSAATTAELIRKVAAWGVPAKPLEETLESYSTATASVARGQIPDFSAMDAPVCTNPDGPAPHPPLYDINGPYHALEVHPSITFTYGGAKISPRIAKALTLDGYVVPGLYVIGMDAGGFNNWRYCGGLALAFITGKWAGTSVVQELKTSGVNQSRL
jgi:succinate dehydrogenase/fumarate reductase flavoprotein subunit